MIAFLFVGWVTNTVYSQTISSFDPDNLTFVSTGEVKTTQIFGSDFPTWGSYEITLTNSTDFEISADGNESNYGTSVWITLQSWGMGGYGFVQTIYVRTKSTATLPATGKLQVDFSGIYREAVLSYSLPRPNPVTNITFENIGSTSTKCTGWTGNADGYLVLLNNSNSFSIPADDYIPAGTNTVWQNAGEQVVYFGTSIPSNLTITNLNPAESNYIKVYAYRVYGEVETYETTGTVAQILLPKTYVTATSGSTNIYYRSLKEAVDKVNSGVHKGSVTIQICGSSVETSTVQINASGSGLANYTSLLIYPTSSGITISGNIFFSGLITLNATSNVVIDGRVNQTGNADLTFKNISEEYPDNTRSAISIYGATNGNTIKYCNIQTRSVCVSIENVANNNTIEYNNITGILGNTPYAGIYANSGSFNVIRYNNFYDISNHDFIYLGSNTSDWTINNNSFYSTVSYTLSSQSLLTACININSGNNYVIKNNYIGGSEPECGGNPWTVNAGRYRKLRGIYLNTASATSASTIEGNIIRNFNYTHDCGEESFICIDISKWANITGNTIGATTGTGSIIYTDKCNIESFVGIKCGGNCNVSNNTIGSVTLLNPNDLSIGFYGIQVATGSENVIINNNLIGSETTANSIYSDTPEIIGSSVGIFFGIHISFNSNEITVSNNTISNLKNSCSSTQQNSPHIYGIYHKYGALRATNNTIKNLYTALPPVAYTPIIGLYNYGVDPSPASIITGNRIYNCYTYGSSNSSIGSMYGMWIKNHSTNKSIIANNYIGSLGSTTSSINVTGIYIMTKNADMVNNIIRLGDNNILNATGISIKTYGTATSRFYFNTVHLFGTLPPSTASESNALYLNDIESPMDIQNNILCNERSTTGIVGYNHYAFYKYGVIGAPNLDYNTYIASGNGGTLGYFSVDKTSLPLAIGQDAHSVTTLPAFTNPTGTTPNDCKPTANLVGTEIIEFSTDFNGDVRSNPPSMGALNKYVIPAPEINVKQASSIADGGSYDFGNIILGNNSGALTFTIENLGTANLTLSGTPKVAISGTNASDFTIVQTSITSPIAASGITTFTITFTPGNAGARTADISIANDDSDENPYNFTITGTGTAPEIDVLQSITPITPITDGGSYDFGSQTTSTNTDIVFTIQNTGTGSSTLGSFTITGTDAGQFSFQGTNPTTVSASGTTSFTIRFAPTSLGAKTANISFANQDSDENPYNFTITGTGTTPAYTVTYNANGGTGTLTDGSSPYNNNTSVTVLANTFTRTGYTFNGWNTASDGSGTNYVATNTFNITANTTLYAKWTVILAPEINVKQSTTSIADNSGSHDFGSQTTFTNTDIIFTIENTGSAASTLGSFTISGTNANQFSLQGINPTTVANGISTTFTIRFTPTTAGAKTATISFANQDADENPYNFTITGTGTATGITIWVGPEPAYWTNGTPDASINAIIDWRYNENINIVCKDLTINAGKNLEIQPLYNVTVNGNLINNGSLILDSQNNMNPSGSLITTGTITNNGAMRGDRYIIPNRYYFMATPLDANSLAINSFSQDYVWTYNESYNGPENDDAWDAITSVSETIKPGIGYLVKSSPAYNTNFVIPFAGTFRTGNFSLTNLPLSFEGYNLVGNPYPSAIDWNLVTKSNVSATYWLWKSDGITEYSGAYATWNGSAGVNGGTQTIAAMQSFMVQVSNTTNSLNFSNSKVHSGVVYKSEISDLIKLTVTGNNFNDEIALYFDENNEDSKKFLSWNTQMPQIYSLENENKLAINKLQDVKSVQSIKMGITCDISGNYTITANEFTFNNLSNIVLEDTKTGIFTTMKQDAVYSFNYEKGEPEERFVLHFNYVATDVENIENQINIYAYAKNIYFNNIENVAGTVNVYNVLGQNVLTTDLKSVINTNLQAGVYVVEVVSNNQNCRYMPWRVSKVVIN